MAYVFISNFMKTDQWVNELENDGKTEYWTVDVKTLFASFGELWERNSSQNKLLYIVKSELI